MQIKAVRRLVRRNAYWLFLLSQFPRLRGMVRSAGEERQASGLLNISETPELIRRSERLFILGSGASINDLPSDFWDVVRSSDSIGFNNWMVHWFVPDFYMRETPLESIHNQQFAKILKKKHETFAPLPYIARRGFTRRRREVWPEGLKVLQDLVTGPICLPNVINVPAETEEEMRKFCRIWRRLGLHKNADLHLDIRASILQLTYFGFVQGYKEIVLCGIDLVSKEYFWEDPRWSGEDFGLPPNKSQNERHRTLDPEFGLPIDRVICALNDELLVPEGVKLYVASPKSALAAFLPIYELATK
ncbi:MAG: hypothetical protein ACE368_06605 [Paracoccaceae bacterium]